MKSPHRSLLQAALLAALGLGISMVHGQPVSSAVSAPATQKQISIELPAFASGRHWAVALEPQDGLQQLAVEPYTVLPLDPYVRPHIDGKATQPMRAGFQIADSAFRLGQASDPGLSVLLDVHLPAGKIVSVSSGGSVVFAGSVTGPALIIDGQMDPKSDHPALRARNLLALPMAIPDELGPDLRADWNGETAQASTAGLRRHLLSLPPAAQHALEGAKFAPFVQDGKPIEVNGVVQYSLSDNGDFLDVSIK
jgi:hypothetical protein